MCEHALMKLSSGALVETFTFNDCHKRAENSGTQAPVSGPVCSKFLFLQRSVVGNIPCEKYSRCHHWHLVEFLINFLTTF